MSDDKKKPIPFYELASSDDIGRFPGYERLIRKKQREYVCQNQRFADMPEDPAIAKWLSEFHLWDSENEEEIRLNDIQKHESYACREYQGVSREVWQDLCIPQTSRDYKG